MVREAAPAPAGDELARLIDAWPGLKEKVAKRDLRNKAIWVDARPVAVDAQHVVIGFDAEFPQEAQQAAKGRDSRVVLENVLGTFLGRKVAVKFVTVARELGAPPAPAAPTGQPSAKLPAAADAAPAPAPMGEGRKGKSVQEWTKDPTVSKTLEMFNGSIVDVRE